MKPFKNACADSMKDSTQKNKEKKRTKKPKLHVVTKQELEELRIPVYEDII